MKKKLKFTALFLTIAMLFTLAACGEKKPYTPVAVGDSYRDFTAQLVSGGTFKLSDYEGKVILLNFWATWCGPCVGEMPAFPRLIEKYGDDLVIAAVNSGEDKETVSQFLTENGYDFPVILDEDHSVSYKYPSDGLPYTVIIGKDGKIAKIESGASTADWMFELYSEEIDKLL